MGHHYYKSEHVSRSRSSHALRVVRGAPDTFGYSVEDTICVRESMHSISTNSSGSRKAYGPSVLKHRIRGVEGQVWTNLASWTGGRVDAVDFGRKEAKRVHEVQHSSSRHRHHHHHHRHKQHSPHRHHYHQHQHTHHHYHGRDVGHDDDHNDDHRYRHRAHRDHDDLSDVTRRLSRSLRVASPTRASSSPPSSSRRSSPRPRSLARVPPSPYPTRRPATTPFSEAGISDPPPPYSSRAGGSSARNRDRDRASTHKSHDRGGPVPSYRTGAGAESTSTLFSPSQREVEDGCQREMKEREKKDGGGARPWDARASAAFHVPDADVHPVFGGGHAAEKASGSGSGNVRERGRDRGRARAEAKYTSESPPSSYLVPGASAGTNLGQCPYLRRLHGAA